MMCDNHTTLQGILHHTLHAPTGTDTIPGNPGIFPKNGFENDAVRLPSPEKHTGTGNVRELPTNHPSANMNMVKAKKLPVPPYDTENKAQAVAPLNFLFFIQYSAKR